MPLRGNWQLQREGITLDTIIRLIRRIVLNPVLTVPLLLAAKYTQRGQQLATVAPGTINRLKVLKALVAFGLFRTLNGILDRLVQDNFKSDIYDWNKEVVVVTGGSDGIGSVVTRLLAEKGVKIAVMDVQPLTYKAPAAVSYFYCDLTSPSSISEASASIRLKLGNPTILINNAGCARGKPILETTPSDLRLTFAVNTLAHYHLVQEFLPSMIRADHGMIVTVTSIASYITAPRMVDYAASKAAALAFHEGLHAELTEIYNAPKVRTIVVCPGYTRTKLFEGFDEGNWLNPAMYPETVAEVIVQAVLKGRSDHIMIPEANWFLASRLRSWPLWMQMGLRKRLGKVMSNWKGRQVVQPSEGVTEG